MTIQTQKDSSVFSAEPKPLVVVGIPAFNEERSIAKIVLEAQKFADVVLVCDDGSTDMTAEIAERLGADVISHEKNCGYGAAIKTLFATARELNADILVTLDGDGQHKPQEIPKLIQPILDDDADVVLGSRFLDENKKTNGVPRYRSLGIQIISKLTGAASNHNFKDAQCGFRVYGRKALNGLNLVENGMGSSVEVLVKAKNQDLRVMEVSAACKYDSLEQTSTHNPIGHGVSVVMSIIQLVVEERPLTFLGIPGLISLFAGIGFGTWMLKLFIEENQIITNIALASIAFTIIGMFMIFTAITLYAISRQKKN
ncbi:MAG: glycosyltransferase family 2 protein [Candidatus Bathyarchaeum tardum]|nr:MAG: glycosyltransferase family 2 protein [Candidatus Bathyarchaeum tardum]